jgi:hypothetical protein
LIVTCVPNEYKSRGNLAKERYLILKMLVNHGADATGKDSLGKPAVPRSLKMRGYKDDQINRMLSPDQARKLTI